MLEENLLGLEELSGIIKDWQDTTNNAINTNPPISLLDGLLNTAIELKNAIQPILNQLAQNKTNHLQDDATQSVLKQGLEFVYYLREFVTQEEMIFIYTYRINNKQIESKEVSLRELFANVSIQQQFFALQKSLAALGKIHEMVNLHHKVTLKEFQEKILTLGTVAPGSYGKDEVNKATKFFIQSLRNNRHRLYQKLTDDTHVYVAYIGARHARNYYYNKRAKNYYNEGWLNEWSRRIYEAEDEASMNYVANYKKQRSIARLIFGIDNNPGSLGGDIQHLIRYDDGTTIRQQLQLKTDLNRHIISFTQLLNTLIQIIKYLQLLKTKVTRFDQSKEFIETIEVLYKTTNAAAIDACETLLMPLQKFVSS